jgi:glycosyltransferase involved in cell wall biosynthesis
VAVSRALADEAVGLGVSPERIVFIPNGVDTALYHAVAASQRAELRGRLGLPDGPLALFVGRLHPVKLLSVLLYAWERVAERCGDAHLLLVGDGPQRAELEQQVATAGLGDRVTFLGAVADPVLYYQTANVFVLPSASEGLSNAMLEAMACGLPVVVTAVSGAADVVRDGKNGKLVPPNKPNALAEILIELIEDVEQRLELGDQARRTVARHYSMEAMGARYEQLYLALLSLAEP